METYVEVALVYNNKLTIIKNTNTDEGSAPKWNEVLTFNLFPKDGKSFTKEELMTADSRLVISLFDKRRNSFPQDGKTIM